MWVFKSSLKHYVLCTNSFTRSFVTLVSTYTHVTNKTLRTQKVVHISTEVNSECVFETTTWAVECGPVVSLLSYSLLLPAHEESTPHTSKLNEMLFLWSQIFLCWFYITLFYCLPAFLFPPLYSNRPVLFSLRWSYSPTIAVKRKQTNAIQTLLFIVDFSLAFVLSFETMFIHHSVNFHVFE